ncbi:AAEL010874-PA [Aedes aegypti]|uniref:AAEL010874-PA n=1 Tax=Aedes aegypti TaxID=7159 RepID=Q16RQ8_AEDAE|nr:AAEL010874-PA [Aedes aegypti]
MQVFAAIVKLVAITLGAIIASISCIEEHSASLKSILSSTAECNLYLPTEALRQECGTRCVSLVNRIWNDTNGRLSDTIGRFYVEGPQDPCARNRTLQCLEQVTASIPIRNSCKLADASVNCYRNNYGQLDVKSPRFVAFSDVQQVRILTECAAMLGVSDKLVQVVRNGLQSIPEGACLLRCLLIRQGLYSDQRGPDLKRVSVQCGGYEGYEQEWRANVTRCVAAVHAERICDKCLQAERIAVDCLQMHLHLYEVRSPKLRQHIPFGVEFYTRANAAAGSAAAAQARVITYITVEYYYWY